MPGISNEVLLIISVFVYFLMTLLWYMFLGTRGLMCFTVIATIAANIEVMIMVDAFGMSQTLGNVLFASTFLITDILSEVAGKKQANAAVNAGILTCITFIIISQSWLLYTPNSQDFASDSIRTVFSNTPRLMFVGLIVYAIVQRFDVWMYHKLWSFTEKKFASEKRFLWLRNNASTLTSQLLNTVLFTAGAFWGVYDFSTLCSIVLSSYVIFIFTSLLDTPFVYIARYMKDKKMFNCCKE